MKERVGEAAERPVAAAGDRAGDPADGRIRPLVTTYLGRRMPWGTPWWTYALALGAANLARQVVIPDGLSSAVEVGIFVLMVGVVGGVVTVVDLTVRRRPAPARTIERAVRRPTSTAVEPAVRSEDRPTTRWAPWWLYVTVILGGNLVRQALAPATMPALAAATIAVALALTLFIAVTAVSRRVNR